MPSKNTNTRSKQKSWLDDIPVCEKTGVGSCSNRIYLNEDDEEEEDHVYEDRSFCCQLDEVTYLYGLFDGFTGTRAAEFCSQRMAAEIILGQLIEKRNDEEIKEVLRQAYIAVEKSYLDSIDELLAEKLSLQLPSTLPAFDAYLKYPHIFEQLKVINEKLSSGTSAAVVLIYNDRLYVANVGNSRVLLCKTDENGVFRVVQLSVDHDLRNEDELLRLAQLGITSEKFRNGTKIGNQETTRCIGNYLVKGDYKEYEELNSALSEPVIAEPEIYGGIDLDDCCKFLILISSGFYKCLEEVIPSNEINKHVVQLVVEQFRLQSTLNEIAQAVVEKAIRLQRNHITNRECKHDDMTFIIRNFNFPLNSTQNTTNTTNSSINTNNDDDTNSNDSSDGSDANIIRLKPYVDFSIYYINIKRAQNNEPFVAAIMPNKPTPV